MDICVFKLLNGPSYDTDKISVDKFVVSFTRAKISKGWVKTVTQLKDGRHDVTSINDYFSGGGSTYRHISVMERLRQPLHYQRQTSTSFEVLEEFNFLRIRIIR